MNRWEGLKSPSLNFMEEYDDKERSCTRKVKYPRIEVANAAIRSMEVKGVHGLEPYSCHYCLNFHIGHGMTVTKAFKLAKASVNFSSLGSALRDALQVSGVCQKCEQVFKSDDPEMQICDKCADELSEPYFSISITIPRITTRERRIAYQGLSGLQRFIFRLKRRIELWRSS